MSDDLDARVEKVLERTKELKREMLEKLGYDPKDRFVPRAEHGRVGRHAFCRAMLEFLDENFQRKPETGARFVVEYGEDE